MRGERHTGQRDVGLSVRVRQSRQRLGMMAQGYHAGGGLWKAVVETG